MQNKWIKVVLVSVATAIVLVACGGDGGDKDPGAKEKKVEKAIFSFYDQEHGQEPWITDGKPSGTKMLKDVTEGSKSSVLSEVVEMDNEYYFVTSSEDRIINNLPVGKLWKSDGTTEGTVLIKDLSFPNTKLRLFKLNDELYILRDNGLWKSDGTQAGTTKIKSFEGVETTRKMAVSNDRVYFIAYDDEHGGELWSSDGTATGTKIVKDIADGAGSSTPYNFEISNNKLYFTAEDNANGRNLWVTDGTEAGTKMVNNIPLDEYPDNLTDINGVLYFYLYIDENHNGIWKINNSTGNAEKVIDMKASKDRGDLRNFTSFDHSLYFTANDPLPTHELWVSDGTEEGTVKVKDFNSYVYYQRSAKNGLLFESSRNEEYYLWGSDGTEEGTIKIATFKVRHGAFQILNDTIKNNRLIITEDDNHLKVLISDGTKNGTTLLKDSPYPE